MKSMRLFKGIGLTLVGSLISLSTFAEDTTEVAEKVVKKAVVNSSADLGRQYFEGSKGFLKGGPACITCHNVKNDALIPGGLFAKDLTDVYERMGEGITGWLSAPPFPAMISSYQNHELTEIERGHLTAFFKHANEVKDDQKPATAAYLFLLGGLGGLGVILIIISLMYMRRKKQMVKKDIFARQHTASDAKH